MWLCISNFHPLNLTNWTTRNVSDWIPGREIYSAWTSHETYFIVIAAVYVVHLLQMVLSFDLDFVQFLLILYSFVHEFIWMICHQMYRLTSNRIFNLRNEQWYGIFITSLENFAFMFIIEIVIKFFILTFFHAYMYWSWGSWVQYLFDLLPSYVCKSIHPNLFSNGFDLFLDLFYGSMTSNENPKKDIQLKRFK